MIELKIGRNTYDVTEKDEFMDNGSVVQLLTQSKERYDWGHQPNPGLSKRAIKEISKFDRVQQDHNYGTSVSIFRLKIKSSLTLGE